MSRDGPQKQRSRGTPLVVLTPDWTWGFGRPSVSRGTHPGSFFTADFAKNTDSTRFVNYPRLSRYPRFYTFAKS
jgi:hypothetical protein